MSLPRQGGELSPEDEDDVEGHSLIRESLPKDSVPKADDDDVEGHSMIRESLPKDSVPKD